jgi:hypothetical protein
MPGTTEFFIQRIEISMRFLGPTDVLGQTISTDADDIATMIKYSEALYRESADEVSDKHP